MSRDVQNICQVKCSQYIQSDDERCHFSICLSHGRFDKKIIYAL